MSRLSFGLFSTNDVDDAGPSDYDPRDIMLDETNDTESNPVKSLQVDTKEGDAVIREELKRELLLLASVTNRGTWANQEERDIISDIVTQLEALNPTPEPVYQMIHDNDLSEFEHEWDLVVTNTQLFRASPFFLVIRSLLKEKNTANDVFDLYNQLTSVTKIGRVREIFQNGVLKSEIDLEVGFFKSTIITQAKLPRNHGVKHNIYQYETNQYPFDGYIPITQWVVTIVINFTFGISYWTSTEKYKR
jgi:hypothetical protein